MSSSSLLESLNNTEGLEKVEALANLSEMLANESDFFKSIEFSEEGLKILESFQEPELELKILNAAAKSHYNCGNYKTVLKYLHKAIAITTKLGDKKGLAVSLNIAGRVYAQLNRYDEATKSLFEAIEIYEQIQDSSGISSVLNNLSGVCHSVGDSDKAVAYINRAIESMIKPGDNREGQALLYNNLGDIHFKSGNLDKALLYFKRSLDLKEKSGKHHLISHTLDNLGQIYQKKQNHKKALEFFYRALEIASRIGYRHMVADSLLHISLSLTMQGETERAFNEATQAMKIAEDLKVPELLKACCKALSFVAETNGDICMALGYHKRYKEYSDDISSSVLSGRFNEMFISYETGRLEQQANIQRIRNSQLKKVNRSLIETLQKKHSFSGEFLICSKCGKFQNPGKESTVKENSGKDHTHNLCGICAEEVYPDTDRSASGK